MSEAENRERRRRHRRRRLIRNLFSYFNRRNLFKKGRRKNEGEHHGEPDWFERERNKRS